jgi:hypothetical protein
MSEAPTTPTTSPTETLYEAPAEAPTAEVAAPEGEAPAATPDSEAAPTEQEAPAEDKGEDSQSAPVLELKLPEGVELQPDLVSGFTELAAKRGLDQEAAQEVFDYGIKLLQEQAEASAKAWNDTVDAWETELKTDPAFSGEREVQARATLAKAIEVYGTPEVREAFDLTGAGSNPAVVRFIHKMATALNEGTIVAPGGPPSQRRSGIAALYGDSQ